VNKLTQLSPYLPWCDPPDAQRQHNHAKNVFLIFSAYTGNTNLYSNIIFYHPGNSYIGCNAKGQQNIPGYPMSWTVASPRELKMPFCITVWQQLWTWVTHKMLTVCSGLSFHIVKTAEFTNLVILSSLGLSKSFLTGHLEQELQMVQLSAPRCSCITILWVSLVSFATITLCVASQQVFFVVSIYFIIDSVQKLIHPCTWIYDNQRIFNKH
jgi:hypothetical protein